MAVDGFDCHGKGNAYRCGVGEGQDAVKPSSEQESPTARIT